MAQAHLGGTHAAGLVWPPLCRTAALPARGLPPKDRSPHHLAQSEEAATHAPPGQRPRGSAWGRGPTAPTAQRRRSPGAASRPRHLSSRSASWTTRAEQRLEERSGIPRASQPRCKLLARAREASRVCCLEQQQSQARDTDLDPRAVRLRASQESAAPKGAWTGARPGVCTASARRGRPAPAESLPPLGLPAPAGASPASSDSASSLWPTSALLSLYGNRHNTQLGPRRTDALSQPGGSSRLEQLPNFRAVGSKATPQPCAGQPGSVLQCPGTSGRHPQALETQAPTALGPRRAAAAAHGD